jgi:hypothetical protein
VGLVGTMVPLFKKREMIYIYPIHISIQPSFKSTNEFVGPNVSSINPIVDLKMKCVEDVFIYIKNICLFFFGSYFDGLAPDKNFNS